MDKYQDYWNMKLRTLNTFIKFVYFSQILHFRRIILWWAWTRTMKTINALQWRASDVDESLGSWRKSNIYFFVKFLNRSLDRGIYSTQFTEPGRGEKSAPKKQGKTWACQIVKRKVKDRKRKKRTENKGGKEGGKSTADEPCCFKKLLLNYTQSTEIML